jgi:hypothetical protein
MIFSLSHHHLGSGYEMIEIQKIDSQNEHIPPFWGLKKRSITPVSTKLQRIFL